MSAHDRVVEASATGVGVSTNAMDFRALVTQAQTNADFDSKLTVMEALKKHKKAVFWAMILSTSLVMEGYDLVIVSVSYRNLTTMHQLTLL
jgi:SP family general alpha glucoside:H+ symporter-like MFS transporter